MLLVRKSWFLLLLLVACGSKARDVDSSLLDGGGVFGGPDGSVPTLPECADSTKDIYVITQANEMYEFHPPTLEFKSLGLLKCPTGGATPTSMAVDRMGVAWVRHSDTSIWKVSTRDLSCEPTAFQAPGEAFSKFGMGFSTESKGGTAEALFLSDHDGAGLAKLDTTTLKLRIVGPYTGDLAGKTSELTGTGDGTLYGFFVTTPAQVAEISKGTGEILTTKPLPGVAAGDAWAFSFYGGDFYIYTSPVDPSGLPLAGLGSTVTRYRPSDGTITVVKDKLGFTIVGAGVSTCAPTSLPR